MDAELFEFLNTVAGPFASSSVPERSAAMATSIVADLGPGLTMDLGEVEPANGMLQIVDCAAPREGNSPVDDGSIAEFGRALRRGETSSVDFVGRLLRRLRQTEPLVRAWTHVDEEKALQEAERADLELARGNDRGPLHGVPVGVKDLIEVAGLPSTAGSRQLEGYVSTRDASCVARLRMAGAIVLGKTNTHEYALGGTTPPTRNPWALDRIPGGSSGGSAAAVAVGNCPLALGTDTAGSIRIPASFCGIAGLKPTLGRVPRDGIFPMAWSMDAAGPMARRVSDLGMALNALAGFASSDPFSAHQAVPDFCADLGRDLRGFRIGVPRKQLYAPAQADTLSAVERALEVFQGLGAELVEVVIPNVELSVSAALVIFLTEASEYHRSRLRNSRDRFEAETAAFLEGGLAIPGHIYVRCLRLQRELSKDIARCMESVDLLALPTIPCEPAFLGAGTFDQVSVGDESISLASAHIRNNVLFSLAGLPASSQPCGMDRNGVPIGLQCVGRPWEEATVLRAMHAYESATDWHMRTPSVSPAGS
jgi:aspartyl-tRNA(Asn)/glutamyl-tRNA(Gln) amidotransferase subunit A